MMIMEYDFYNIEDELIFLQYRKATDNDPIYFYVDKIKLNDIEKHGIKCYSSFKELVDNTSIDIDEEIDLASKQYPYYIVKLQLQIAKESRRSMGNHIVVNNEEIAKKVDIINERNRNDTGQILYKILINRDIAPDEMFIYYANYKKEYAYDCAIQYDPKTGLYYTHPQYKSYVRRVKLV